VFFSDDPLDEMFSNKFQRVTVSESRKAKRAEVVEEVPAEQDESEDTPGVEVETKNPYGEDVTSQFSTAEVADVLVFHSEDSGFTVTSKDDPHDALNPAPLTTKRAVKNFISGL
jgi:hypothetical protein